MIHSIGKKVSQIFHSVIANAAKQSSSPSLRDFRQKIVAIQCMHFHSLDCHVASLLAMTNWGNMYS